MKTNIKIYEIYKTIINKGSNLILFGNDVSITVVNF